VSDIQLYNQQKVIEGLENDNLFDLLAEELERGREHYKSRVDPQLYATNNFYNRAIVDIMIRSKAHIKTKIW